MINKIQATPKVLTEAIDNALETIAHYDIKDRKAMIEILRLHVQDFMAQKFTYHVLDSKDESTATMLGILFKKLTDVPEQ